jgi:hypothetical protein
MTAANAGSRRSVSLRDRVSAPPCAARARRCRPSGVPRVRDRRRERRAPAAVAAGGAPCGPSRKVGRPAVAAARRRSATARPSRRNSTSTGAPGRAVPESVTRAARAAPPPRARVGATVVRRSAPTRAGGQRPVLVLVVGGVGGAEGAEAVGRQRLPGEGGRSAPPGLDDDAVAGTGAAGELHPRARGGRSPDR